MIGTDERTFVLGRRARNLAGQGRRKLSPPDQKRQRNRLKRLISCKKVDLVFVVLGLNLFAPGFESAAPGLDFGCEENTVVASYTGYSQTGGP
jgi:hypothetical protein